MIMWENCMVIARFLVRSTLLLYDYQDQIHYYNTNKQVNQGCLVSRAALLLRIVVHSLWLFTRIRFLSRAVVIIVVLSVVFLLIVPLLIRLLLVRVVKRVPLVLRAPSLKVWVILVITSCRLTCGYCCSSCVVMLLDFWIRKNIVSFGDLLEFICHFLRLGTCIWMMLSCKFVES